MDEVKRWYQALTMWQQLAPARVLHQIELLEVLASIQARMGNADAARDSLRRAIALLIDRCPINPVLLARIENLASPGR